MVGRKTFNLAIGVQFSVSIILGLGMEYAGSDNTSTRPKASKFAAYDHIRKAVTFVGILRLIC